MDLTDVSFAQAVVDLAIANNRVLEITQKISVATEELQKLRSEIKNLEPIATPVPNGSGMDARQEEVSLSSRQAVAKAGIPKWLRSVDQMSKALFGRQKNLKKPILWHIDEIGGVPPELPGPHTISSRHLRNFTMSGWAIPTTAKGPFNTIGVRLSNAHAAVAKTVATHERPDVGAHFGDSSLTKSGYRVDFLVSDLPLGLYEIVIDGNHGAEVSAPVKVGELEIR